MSGTNGYVLPRSASGASLARWLLPLAVGFVAGAGLVELSPSVAALIRSHPYFAVRRITVRGNKTIGRDAILNAAGLRAGMSIWEVRPQSGANAIAALARARRARVWREFPDRVVVAVTESEPQAIAVLDGLRYVDRSGRILDEVRPGDLLELPFLTGLDESFRGGAGRRTLTAGNSGGNGTTPAPGPVPPAAGCGQTSPRLTSPSFIRLGQTDGNASMTAPRSSAAGNRPRAARTQR